MNVHQVKQITGEWLNQNMAQYPGLCAAHFVGSINTMPDEAYFPAYKDVDLHLIFKDGSPALENHGPFANILETEYRGVIIEGGYKPLSDYQTPEKVLSNPEITHHLTVDSLLYDPDGWLKSLQAPVRDDYACCKWVLARVDFERKGLEQWQQLRSFARTMDSSGSQEIQLLGYHLTYLVALLCVATLQAPSSGYGRMRDILAENDHLDLYEQAISILGLRNISADQFEGLLQEGIEAFDLAVQVRRSPNPFQHKLNPHQRRYFVDKCRSLIEAGLLEQAAGWMIAFYLSSVTVILADGPDDVKPLYVERRNKLIKMLGMDTPESIDEHYQRIMRLDDAFFKLADELIQRNPVISD
jgi:hypothetical protein